MTKELTERNGSKPQISIAKFLRSQYAFRHVAKLYDSHNHLQDERLQEVVEELPALVQKEGIARMVVNGTQESDWPRVRELAQRLPVVFPSFGLHPWYIPNRSPTWQDQFRQQLDQGQAAVGEIGLDRWIEGHDLPEQEKAFRFQMGLAAERNLPVSIHCLRAWGRLFDLLRNEPCPARGFLLHSYGGPLEMVEPLAQLGAYFSVSGHFAHPRKERQREVFRLVPIDRLLIETDAPDMLPPEHMLRYRLAAADANHPGNLASIYAFAAELRGQPLDRITDQVEQNFLKFFADR